MLEHLNLVASLYKLLIYGLTKVRDNIKASRKKSIQRKIIEIQLLLEDIIDNAQEVISTVKNYGKKKKITRQDIEELERMLYSQSRRLSLLLQNLRDDTSAEIMRLFTPDIRRRIIDLIHIKGGAIEQVLFMINRFGKIKLVKNQPVIQTYADLQDWSHDIFVKEGKPYVNQLLIMGREAKVSILGRQREQEQVVNELIECSKKLSDFIKSQIGIEDII